MADEASGVRTGIKQVATAGTRVQVVESPLIATVAAYNVTIQTLSTNEGVIVLGDKEVVAAAGSHASPTCRGLRLKKEESVTLRLDDISQLWMDTDKSGDGISWLLLVA